MIDFYETFVKPCEIRKDINYFTDDIKNLIINKFLGKHILYTKKNSSQKTYTISNHLSLTKNTKMKFIHDKINISFNSNDEFTGHFGQVELDDDSRIKDIELTLNIKLSKEEINNKIISRENSHHIRKMVNEIYVSFKKLYVKREKEYYELLQNNLLSLEKFENQNSNRFFKYLIDVLNKNYKNDIPKLKEIMYGFRHDNIFVYHDVLNSMQFYMKNSSGRTIKSFKFLKRLKPENFEDFFKISSCLGHELRENEISDFIDNIVNHFNPMYQDRELEINNCVNNCFEEIRKTSLRPPTFFQE
jgi:hypothetical protein